MKKKIKLILYMVLLVGVCFFAGWHARAYFFDKVFDDDHYWAKEGFSVKVLDGWDMSENYLSTPTMIVEDEENEEVPEFKSYFTFVYEESGGKSEEQFYNYVENEIINAFSNFEIIKNENWGGGKVVMAKVEKDEHQFVIALGIVKAKTDGYWIISFNTLESRLSEYEPLFYEVLGSFSVR